MMKSQLYSTFPHSCITRETCNNTSLLQGAPLKLHIIVEQVALRRFLLSLAVSHSSSFGHAAHAPPSPAAHLSSRGYTGTLCLGGEEVHSRWR